MMFALSAKTVDYIKANGGQVVVEMKFIAAVCGG